MIGTLESMILDTIRSLGEDHTIKVPEDLSIKTVLFGKEGILDSLGLVTLVAELENAIHQKFDKLVALADEKALSEKNSPYQTVSSLARYADRVIANNE